MTARGGILLSAATEHGSLRCSPLASPSGAGISNGEGFRKVAGPEQRDTVPSPGENAGTTNSSVLAWVHSVADLCEPDEIYWCDGSASERQLLTADAINAGVLIPLNQRKRPGCYLHRSHPNDVARVEELTFICTQRAEDAGPTNNWAEPRVMLTRMEHLASGGMRGRTMYVVPYVMGPPGSPFARVGVEITDSIYVALSMRIMARVGNVAWRQLGASTNFNRGVHCMLDLDPARRFICHFPEENLVFSVGSNYGGNVLLSKKCFALRIGSWMGRQEGWLAEHMLLLSIESPAGERSYIAAAYPSACGKTNLAMLVPPPPFDEWKIRTIGDDIAWARPDPDGRLYAINPEAGYFGVLPGTNSRTNPNAVATISHDTIFTNAALLPDGDVWWEGKDGPVPKECLDWRGQRWTPDSSTPAAHPNSRFTAPLSNNPAIAQEAWNPRGVPISAIVFGGRRATTVPLVFEALDWAHGVYLGATMSSETTAAANGAVGVVRRDPMAMRPFCGYHMAEYLEHWLALRDKLKLPPRIFHVNWFRKGADGKFLWPGFGENIRVLQWIIDRCNGRADATKTPLGWAPDCDDLDLSGLPGAGSAFAELQAVDRQAWLDELQAHTELLNCLGPGVPDEILRERDALAARLAAL